jgi:hypothetical protein
MKYAFAILALLAALGMNSMAQEENPQTAKARDPEIKETMEKMSADIESLIVANVSLQKRISTLADELKRIRDEQVQFARSASIHDDLRKLAENIQEVDRKRESDRELILEQLSKLAKLVAATPAPMVSSDHQKEKETNKPHKSNETAANEKGIYYTVKEGDYLARIVAESNAEFKKKGWKTISIQQVLDANEGLNANKIKKGSKIFIPLPAN